ncbi:DUF58 domain-containing protein [Paenibacillus crassostreae]|uniref:DUF58 domain-containing protein n=1 Tax=Paenibacillus crassostreae TaxID=1763538 RepID=A0A167CUB7_9BACL|nr:DUF58 domain-containing protein [Paenibacillus crassostreae]AOZ93560.1 hypothetical protein LPB68_16085 [Paenibacillus crassostreae]OAB73580.1 hypothetical protein PNBC_13815 [Paenibacillus crassostreae]
MRYRWLEWAFAFGWLGVLTTLFQWYGGATVWFLIVLSTLFIVGGLVTQWFGARSIEVKRYITPSRPIAGTELEIEVCIKYRSILPLPWMSVTDYFTEGNFCKVWFPGWHRTFTYSYNLQNVPRGIVTFQVCQVEWGGLFGWFKNSRMIPCDESIIVLPLPIMVAMEEGITSNDWRAGELEITKRHLIGHWGLEIRDYRVGDPLSRIHWKSSARLGRMQSRLPEDELDQELWIILDQSAESYRGMSASIDIQNHKAEHLFEWAVSFVAGLFQTADKDGMHAELIVEKKVPIPNTFTVSAYQSNLMTLALIELNGTKRIENILEETMGFLQYGGRVAVVTGFLQEESIQVIVNMQHQGIHIDVYSVLPSMALLELKGDVSERIRQVRMENILLSLGVRFYRLNVSLSEKENNVDIFLSKEVRRLSGS